MSKHEARVQRFEGNVMRVNSFLLEGPTGIVIVDGQLTVSDAASLRQAAEGYDKPIAAMILTHGHPDHYAGAAIVLEGLDTPIVATPGVDRVIRRDDELKESVVGPMMGDEWPAHRRFPDQLFEPGSTIELAGVALTVRDLGPGESDHDSMWMLDDRTLFPGDIAYNRMHAYLADGNYTEWLATLGRLEAELDHDADLYLGHGEPTDRAALAKQRSYIEAFVETVASQRDATPEERRDKVVARMQELVPNEDLLFLMELSIAPVLAALGT
jgi:glyoxylase-like metal-dependent hydrolase (beta-lactamase superfamily II)